MSRRRGSDNFGFRQFNANSGIRSVPDISGAERPSELSRPQPFHRRFRPAVGTKDFSVLMAPATGKFTFVNDQRLSDIGAFGVSPGKTFRPEIGAYIKMRWRKDLMKNIEMISKLSIS